ncbi:MAG: DUF362 domain-containing protein [Promethearchaeota archaeon]
MKSDVFFFTARTKSYEESLSKIKGPMALEKIGFKEEVKKNDKVVIKTHFGALENIRYLRPSYIRFLCDYVKELGAIPTVAESCGWGAPESFTGEHTEYSGRTTEQEYLNIAKMHGYTSETMGAPIIMLDGPFGVDVIFQKVKGKIFNEILIAGRLREFDKLVLATHFKGHPGTGFGGAIKNLGIGCVSKGGKVQAHNGKKFEINFDAPLSDFVDSIRICPTGALSINGKGRLTRDEKKCRYCYMCKSVCKNDVIDIGHATREEFITQMVDNALGVVEYFGKEKIYYINFVLDVTYQCDCSGGSDVPFIHDIGILSSRDPVALDQASVDLVHHAAMNPYSALGDIERLRAEMSSGKEWFSYIPRFDPETKKYDYNLEGKESKHWSLQLEVAEKLGLGTRDYNLIEVKIEKKEKNN